jgi:hypothetical protein
MAYETSLHSEQLDRPVEDRSHAIALDEGCLGQDVRTAERVVDMEHVEALALRFEQERRSG